MQLWSEDEFVVVIRFTWRPVTAFVLDEIVSVTCSLVVMVLYGITSIHWPCYIILSMVMSSFIDPDTLYCSWLCRHSLTLLQCTVHGNVVIHWPCSYCTVHGYVVMHWPCYIVLFMVMSSVIDLLPIVLSMVMSSFIDPATWYSPC